MQGPAVTTRDYPQEQAARAEAWKPRALDVPTYREALMRAWSPRGALTRVAPMLRQVSNHRQQFVPWWEYATLRDAELWFVGADMCDLLAGAATDLPATELRPSLVPAEAGFVVFERALEGIDADGYGLGPTHTGAMLWGDARWERTGEPILGVTVYGPLRAGGVLAPIGGLIWPFGRTPDDSLNDMESSESDLSDTAVASMAEDRRRLLALWLLSAQPGLATSIRSVQDRASARRAKRTGVEQAVRVVLLRRRPPATEGQEFTGRTYRHRWTVTGHWRNQAVGEGWSEHRPTYINPHLKGPGDAPLIRSPKVKSWTR